MNGFIDIQFKDLDVLREMVDIAKGFGSQYCSFSISQSRIEIIGSDLSSISSVYVYVSYEISRNVSSSDVPLQMRSFSIPHSIQNTDVVCFKVNILNLAHAIALMRKPNMMNIHMKLYESGERWILLFQHEDFTGLSYEKEIFVLPENFLRSEPKIKPFNVVMELPDFYKVHCVGASMKTFNERIKISANSQGELKLETGHAMFNMITCFNNCINHMDLVEVLEYDNSKFVTINVDSTHFVKFFSVVTEDFYVNFKIVDNYALLFEAEKDDLKVKLILPAKL
ncbi:hypothetical protein F8M41_014275 [Gigaspora margarita]|uniref:Checkpoint protein n=1 Tax=Gigaspora margarita TaxID=4874 RepID=A0A8H3ZZY9_GIGMA|nr:hypothetical protein F8M41_014275 [Gigaspora margarita]